MYLNDFIIIGNDDDTFGWHNVRITVVLFKDCNNKKLQQETQKKNRHTKMVLAITVLVKFVYYNGYQTTVVKL